MGLGKQGETIEKTEENRRKHENTEERMRNRGKDRKTVENMIKSWERWETIGKHDKT